MNYEGRDNLQIMNEAQNYNKFLLKNILSAIPQDATSIVDFGSGDGSMARELTVACGKNVCCVEPAENMLQFYQVPPMNSLYELRDSTVDFIYLLNVLEHIKDDDEIINLFYQKLKKDGKIYLYLPAFDVLFSSMDKKVGHYRRYDKKKLVHLFEGKKWKIVDIRYADFLGFFATFVYKMIGNKNGNINPFLLGVFDKYIFPLSCLLDKLTKGKLLGKNVMMTVKKVSVECFAFILYDILPVFNNCSYNF